MQIEVEVKGQQIKRLNSPGSVEDTLNYLTCHFVFEGEEWGNTVKTAYFRNPASGEKYQKILADDGTCTVPWEALTDQGFVKFSVSGERENYRITTDIESFYNGETVYGGEPSEPPTPSQYDQLIALAEQTKEIAESVREDADAGEFDGPPGPQGPKGENGDTGPRGPAGKDGQNATDEQVRTAVDAYMEEHPIQGDTEDIIKLAIKNETSGAVPIAVTDSADMGVQDLEMQGWTEQAQYEGKNLFDATKDINVSYDGMVNTEYNTYIGNGSIEISAENLQQQSKGKQLGEFNGKTLCLSLTAREGKVAIAIFSNGTSKETHVFEIGVRKSVYFIVDSENYVVTFAKATYGSKNVVAENIMMNEGSTAMPYEPYTGGQPSPSPDYPQEIVSAGNYDDETQKYQYEVKLTGANLFNPEKLTGGEIVEYNGVQCYKYTDGLTNFTYIDDFAENTQYCINVRALRLEENENRLITIRINYTDGSIQRCAFSANELVSLVSSVDKTIESISGDDNYSLVCYLDLSMTTLGIGTEPLPFQPYKEQTVTLTSDRPLTKWDKLEKRNGQWGWVYKSAEIVLDGSERTWRNYPTYKGYFCTDLPFSASRREGYAENIIVDTSMSKASTFSCWLGVNNNFLYVINAPQYDANLPDRGIQNWRDWLSENPLTILTYLDEETFVPLSESEQEQMNALHTYYPTTILDNDQGCDMALTYIADTKAYIDNKVSAIQAAIVNTI